MIAAMVVPLGWLNIASTFACLEFERGDRGFFGRGGRPPTFAHGCLGFGGALLLGHDYLLIGCDSIWCCHHRIPAEATGAGGVKERKRRNDLPFEIRLIRDVALSSVLTS
jgi:hypothetical protein